jgi:peptidoglycan/xylan/chitin deacetylase (PgdA/CDA1 family)
MRNVAKELSIRVIDEIGNMLLRPPLGGNGRVVTHGLRTEKRVALTYDDGPNSPSTELLLDALDDWNVKATFFCVGDNAVRHADIVKRAFAEGHVIGNHSMLHSRKTGLKPREDAHIDRCSEALFDILGVMPRFYRPPWGWLTPWETNRLQIRGLTIVGWDVYTYDWREQPPHGAEMAAGIERDVLPGSIILMHDGRPNVDCPERPQTVLATTQAIRRLREAGYEFVTVADLLGISAYLSDMEIGTTCLSQTS